MAEMSAWISVFFSILSIRARSTFRILPRMGRMAWVRGLRASLAEPPAEFPSTMNSSLSRWVARRAVDQLARQPGPVERRLATGQVARRAGRHPGPRREVGLLDDLVGLAGVLLEPLGQLLVGGPLDERADRHVAELGLCLALELRVAQADGDDGGQSLADVLAVEVRILLLELALGPGVAVHHVGEGLAEALLVHAALDGGDAVGEGVDRLVEPGVPLQRDLDLLVVLGLREEQTLRNSDSLAALRCLT